MTTAKEMRHNFINTCLDGDTTTTFKVIKEINQSNLSLEKRTENIELLNEILSFQIKVKGQPKDTKNLIKLLFLLSYGSFPETLHIFKKLNYSDTCSKSANYIKQLLMGVMSDQLTNKEYVFKFELPEALNLTPIESDKLAKVLEEL